MTYPTLKTHRVTWYTDVEAADALEAVRKVASENFQARIAEGCDGTACVFECREGHEGQPVTIDLAEHRYHLECCHADTCLSDYWGGHHLAHIQVPVHNGMTFGALKAALRRELNQGAVGGADYPGEHNDQWFAGAIAAVNAMTVNEGADPEHLFKDLEIGDDEKDDDGESVYAFFVFRPTDAPDEEGEDDGKPDEADPTCSEFRP